MTDAEIIAQYRLQIAELHSFISVSGNWKALETFLRQTAIPLRDEQGRFIKRAIEALDNLLDEPDSIDAQAEAASVLETYRLGPQLNPTENPDE